MDLTSGQRLKIWRKDTGVSQRELASTLGYAQGYVGNIEAGRSEPSRNFLVSLQDKFGVRADYILYGEGPAVAAAPAASAPGEDETRRDPLIMMFCGGSVQKVYSEAGIKVTATQFEAHAKWMHDELLSRMEDPEDGDEMERLLPVLRQVLHKRLADAGES